METVRGFIHHNEAWYAEAIDLYYEDEMFMGVYSIDEHEEAKGTKGEFSIRWKRLKDESILQLVAFDDAWDILYNEFGPLLKWMAAQNNRNVTPEEVKVFLESIGCKDLTKREIPSPNNQ